MTSIDLPAAIWHRGARSNWSVGRQIAVAVAKSPRWSTA